MKKKIRKFIVFLIMLFIVFSFTKVNSAKALTYSSDRVTFTDDDDFIFQGNSYSIDAYAESIGKNTIHGKAAADDTNHLFLELCHDDDCIVKDCTSNCNLSGYNIIGGVCGRFSGMIDNCTYNGTILVGNGDWANKVVYVGGIVGQLYGDSYGTCYVSSNSKIKWNFNETNDDKLSPYMGIYIGIKANESSFNYGQYTEYESIINTGNLKSSYSYESGWGFWKKTHTVKLPQKDHISNTYGGVM